MTEPHDTYSRWMYRYVLRLLPSRAAGQTSEMCISCIRLLRSRARGSLMCIDSCDIDTTFGLQARRWLCLTDLDIDTYRLGQASIPDMIMQIGCGAAGVNSNLHTMITICTSNPIML